MIAKASGKAAIRAKPAEHQPGLVAVPDPARSSSSPGCAIAIRRKPVEDADAEIEAVEQHIDEDADAEDECPDGRRSKRGAFIAPRSARWERLDRPAGRPPSMASARPGSLVGPGSPF